VALREASIEEEPDGSVIVRFVLPPGSFATVLLDALMAPPADGPGSVRMQG
jgi:tRNA(Glu) U13 pseudouridine synthase TruD